MPNITFSVPGLMELQTPVSDGLPPFFKLDPHSAANSHWQGMATIGPITEDGEPMEFPAAVAFIEFSPTCDGKMPLFTIHTEPEDGEGNMEIVGPAADWLFRVPRQPLPLPVGLWYWSFWVTSTAPEMRKIFSGSILVTS